MKSLAVIGTDGRTEGVPRLASNRGSLNRPLAANARAAGSEALTENDAKDSKRDSYAIPSRILKPNIYYEAHNFAHQVVAA